uniref:paladin n=1 Tax=Myxine glutinosa TaxID=7769 RepID=UPI00358E5E70
MGTTVSHSGLPSGLPCQDIPYAASASVASSSESAEILHFSSARAKSVIANKVAPVVISHNCREEYQIHKDVFKSSYTMGRINEKMPEHFLIQGKYFLVKDNYRGMDVLNTETSMGVANFRQARGELPIYGMGQPTLHGFQKILEMMHQQGHQEILFFCLREEPVLFLRQGDDFIPYSPRDPENLHENLCGRFPRLSPNKLEPVIQRELLEMSLLKENTYYVYNDIEHFEGDPHAITLQKEEDVCVTEEVYKRSMFSRPALRYHRLMLCSEEVPQESQFDAFIDVMRENPFILDMSHPLPALLFSCQDGISCTNLAMIIGSMLLSVRTRQQQRGSSGKRPLKQEGRFQIVQSIMNMIPNGHHIVDEVEDIIVLCAEIHNLKDTLQIYKNKLEAIKEDYQIQGVSARDYFLKKAIYNLQTYFYLIVFYAYLDQQLPLGLPLTFTRWMRIHPDFYRILAQTNLSELQARPDLITKGTRVLVSDGHVSLDIMSTRRDMKVANFRPAPNQPVYGMAQPDSEGLTHLLRYLSETPRAFPVVLWVNLRDQIVLEVDGHTFSPRESEELDRPLHVPVTSGQQIEKLENDLKRELIGCQKWLEVRQDGEKHLKSTKSCLTCHDMAHQQKELFPELQYARVPLSSSETITERELDRLTTAMQAVLNEQAQPALLFSCQDGWGKTTVAMVVTVLLLWHTNGFPDDCQDVDLNIRVPDCRYSKGEFEVVQSVVRVLPAGQARKREVDKALDAVSETMTPMHYHLREIIISTYRQIRSAKTEAEAEMLKLQSLQFLERYILLILFNTYLFLEKPLAWDKPFSQWMVEVAARVKLYDIFDELGFPEFEDFHSSTLSKMRYRWQQVPSSFQPFRGQLV